MKIKCPECDETMIKTEEAHVCESCDHTLSLEEAEEKFKNGELIAEREESDDLEIDEEKDCKGKKKAKMEGDDEDGEDGEDDDDMKEESFNGFSTKETWVSTVISESEYSLYKQIKTAYKKEKLDERFVKSLLENAKEDKFAAELETIDLEEVNLEEVTSHFTQLMKEADEIGVDVATALFADVELTEEQKDEVTTIFESAIDIRVNEIRASLKEEAEVALAEAIEAKEASLEAELSEFADEVVEKWLEDNKIAIESSQKVLNAESALDEIQDVFARHFTHVPEDRYDIVEALTEKVEELEGKVEESEGKEKELSEQITSMKKGDALKSLSEGMVETEKEKLEQLAETVEYTTDEEFQGKITKLKEAFIGSVDTDQDDLKTKETEVKAKAGIYDDIAKAALG